MLVSIIMPIHNSEQHIEEALKSILNQTYKDFEFIIVNDGSKDKSLDIIKKFNDIRIKIINLKHVGISKALNYAIQDARGKFIFRMDSDDISENDRIEVQLKFMLENPDIDLCGSFMKIIDQNGNKISDKFLPITNYEIFKSIEYNSNVMHPTFCFRKESFDIIGGYRDEFIYAQDYDLLLRGISNGFKYYNIPKFLLKYRIPNRIKNVKYFNQMRFSRFARILYFQRKKNKIEKRKTTNKINLINNLNFYNKIVISIFFNFNNKRIKKRFPRFLWLFASYFIAMFHYELLINLYYDTRYYFEIKNVKN